MESVTDKELDELQKQIEEKANAPEPQPEPEKVEAAPEPQAPPTPSLDSQTPQDASDPSKEVAELMRKKGWKTPEDAIKSYTELEKKFHEERQAKDRPVYEAPQGYAPPANPYAPVYAPPPQPSYMPPPQPAYMPPPNYGYQAPSLPPPPIGSQAEAEIAASYNMTVDDFRRIFPMINDMTEVKNRRVQGEFSKWREEMTRETEKNADRTNVLSDPAFFNSDVQNEMHEFFSKNPQVFNERRPYSLGLSKALENLGRKNASRGTQPNQTSLPTDPPKTAGSANGFSGKKGTMPVSDFKKMTLEEQEKVLKGQGAFRTYEDLA